jgi:phosphoribosyl 1,2-cyclic phosphate phosphodiesterase
MEAAVSSKATYPAVTVTCLGTGTSHGIPMIGCRCPVCTSDDPHDWRTRPGLAVSVAGRTILVDTPPELRLQCVAQGITRADAILFTHHHADHVAGLDDVRAFNELGRSQLNCYGMAETLACLRRMFMYAFEEDAEYPSAKPDLALIEIGAEPFEVHGIRILPIPLMHGPLPVLGFRFGGFAYCTDCNFIPEESMARLEGLDVLILDALRRTPHPTHFNLEQAVAAAERIGARRTYFTHIAHELRHSRTNAELPKGMALAYDGLRIELAAR